MRMRSSRDIASAVRGRRQELGLSQAELANRAKVSRKWISEVEAGKPTAELQLVIRVLEALGLMLDLAVPGTTTAAAERERGEPPIDLDAILDQHRRRA